MPVIHHLIDFSFVIGLLVNALLFIPQAQRLMKSKDSKEVSLITFFGFLLIQSTTMLHGFIDRDFILAYGTIISMITCGFVVYLIIYYRVKKTK